MNETLVSLYYQGYRLLYFTLFQFFFWQFHTIKWLRFTLEKE